MILSRTFGGLKCPECIFDTKDEEYFQLHAIENHPESLKLFDKPVKEEARGTSFENEEQNSKLTDYFNKIPNDSLYLSSICPEILMKEEEGNESLNGDILRESVY